MKKKKKKYPVKPGISREAQWVYEEENESQALYHVPDSIVGRVWVTTLSSIVASHHFEILLEQESRGTHTAILFYFEKTK